MTVLRADLHVHTCYSRRNGDLPFLGARDCYSPPEAVYRVAKARGMDVVAITDHDTIAGALALVDRLPDARDIIVGEEVSCWLPDTGIEVHLGVYGMTESLHRELQPLRPNAFDVIERLGQGDVFFVLNHLLHFYDTGMALEAYLRLLDVVPGLEVRNGTMLAAHNNLSQALAAAWARQGSRLAVVAGSDAHTLRRVGTTWTEAPGHDAVEFLSNVRAGLGRPAGHHGGALAVAGDAYGVIGRFMASLMGVGPRDHRGWQRAARLGFCLGSLPFQFLPIAIAWQGKARERRKVGALGDWMASGLPAGRREPAEMVRAEP